ncbi:MAG: TonB-dependent receptor [Bacteroidetes bacterium]|nr:MAG: TonB-dependent receptor [Bacteroidota bacterium]
MKYKILLCISLVLLLTGSIANVYAQGTTVTGVVTDSEDGSTLPGVTIQIKGTQKGAVSDFDGVYTLSNVSSEDILIFAYIGYKRQEILIGNQTTINVVMEGDVETLDEIVITGYGVQKKSDVTGAVASVEMDELVRVPVASVTQAMQGLAAGVNVTQNTGAPGAGVAVRIRGVGSISSGNAPLYIVDGVPTENAMNYISTADIESISVLKDAASAAIYGSRANNGVVIITTKKGSGEKGLQITFNSSFGFQQVGHLTEMANKAQYIELYNEAAENDNVGVVNPRLQRKLITEAMADTLPDVNHLEAIFRNARIQNHYLGISGGDEKTHFNISGSYFEQEGIVLGSDYERFTGKVSVNTKAKDWLNVGINLNIAHSTTSIIGSSGDGFGGNGGSVVRYAFFRTPTIPILDNNGEYVDLPQNPEFFGDGYNPVGLANNMHNIRSDVQILGDVNFKIDFSENISFSSKFGVDSNNNNKRRFNKTWGTNDRINNPNSLTVNNGSFFSWTWTNLVNFNYDFGDHNLTAVLGTEAISLNSNGSATTARDFADQDLNLITLNNGQGVVSASEDLWEYRLFSYFGRANYNFKEKYFVTAIVRRDASTRFEQDNRWGTFPSLSLGWRIDREGFLLNSRWIDQWKLRAGYGANGNQNINNFAYLEKINSGFEYPFGGVPQSGYTTTELGNAEIKWETSTQIDIGTDLSIYNGKLLVAVDYYRKVTNDQLVRNTNPSSAGYASPAWINAGKTLNSGIELEIGHKGKISDEFNYSINANAATLHNEVLELDGSFLNGRIDNGVWATKTEQGHSVGSFYLYEMEGIFQNATDIFTHAYQGNNILPGDVKYKDQNGDGIIDANDRTHVGKSIPDVILGLNLGLNYKNFDLNLFFQGAYGQSIYYQVATDIEGFYRPFNLTKRYYDERWTGEGTSNTQPRASWKAKANNTRPSTRFLEDGGYTRLKSLQIGYRLPLNLLEKINIKSFRVYFLANNLLTFTKYPGLDPEMTTSDNSTAEGDTAANIEWGTFPSAVSYNFGIQLTF